MEIRNGTGPMQTGPLVQPQAVSPAAPAVVQPAVPVAQAPADAASLGIEAQAALAAPVAAPPAPPPASAPPKKKKKRGFFGRIASGIKKVAKAAVKVALNPIGTLARVAVKVVKAQVQAVKAVANFVKKNATYILAAAQILCYCFPVLAPLGVAITAYQAAKAGTDVVKGIASGDWKTALTGVVSLAGSFAGGVGAVAKGALGAGAAAAATGLEAVAKTVGHVADGIKAVKGVVDATKGGSIAGALSGVVGFLGDNTQLLSDKTLAVAQKLTSYAERVEQGVAAAKSGNVGLLASTAAGVASDLGGDLRLNEGTRATIDKVGGQVRTAGAVADAVKRRDFNATGQLVGGVIKNERLAQGVKTTGQLARAIQNKDADEILNAAATVTNVFGAGSQVRRLVDEAEAKKKEAEDVIAAALKKGPPRT